MSFVDLEKALGVMNISIPEEGKLSMSLKVKEGTVSLLFTRDQIDTVEVYDPECLLDGGVYYLRLAQALRLILDQ